MKIIKIHDIGRTITGTTPSTKDPLNYNSKDIMFIGPSDIKNNRYIVNTEKHISFFAFSNLPTRQLSKNSIVIDCIGSDMGNVAITTTNCITNQQINAITDINDKNVLYFYYLFSTKKHYFHQIGMNGSTMPIISKSLFDDIEIAIHDDKEQQHIVNILGSIDEKIENNEQKIVKIKELMARLYENISLNKDCVKIGDLTCEIKERLDDRTARAFSVINSGELVEQDSYFDRQIHSKDMYKYKVIRKFDFAYNPSRINIGSVAMFEHDFGAVSPIYIAFSCDKKYSYYINEFIKTEQFNKEICLRANGSVRQSVNYDVFVEIQIPLPDESELTKYNDEYAILQENIDSLKKENIKLNNLKNLYLKKFFG